MQFPSRKLKGSGLSWYWKRSKSVPFAEFPYRVAQFVKKKVDKYGAGSKVHDTYDPSTVKIHKLDISDLVNVLPDSQQQVRAAADRILAHRFEIFGIPIEFGPQIDWHLDPKTLRSWPLLFWGDINYRDGQTIGGIKFAWELNRLHHLPIMAIANAVTSEQKYENEIFRQLRSWLKANPYPQGINWISGIELGIRLVNLVYTLKILPSPISSENHAVLSQFVSLHANHLYRYPSKYTSGANHAVAEALGLFAAGISFPGLQNSRRWKNFGKEVLEREVTRQIYPDGSSFEHSVPYLQFVFDHFLVYLLLCREHGEAYPDYVTERMKASLRFIRTIMDSGGNYPAIGDDDSGYLLKLWFGAHNNFLSILNTGAVLFERPMLVDDATRLDSKTLLLLGGEAKLTETKPVQSEGNRDPTHRYYDNAGLAVIKSDKPVELIFVGNSGPLGLRPLAAHGHADALSFWLSVDGNPVFVDAGTYLYHSGGIWRDYFRSTAAHNTVRIDGENQATISSDFIFDDFYDVFDVDLTKDRSKVVWTAKHNGYRRLADPVTHQRTVTYEAEEQLMVVKDHIGCTSQHLVECFFHLHPDCRVTVKGNEIQIGLNNITLRMQVDELWSEIDLIKGDVYCRGGWYSRRFNELQETVTVKLSAKVAGNSSFATLIYFPSDSRADNRC
jgi:hypothetical protein